MSKKLPWVLIVGGLVVGGIAWFGYQHVNKKSDDEILHDATLDMMAKQEKQRKSRDELMAMVLTAPEECKGVKTGIAFEISEGEPDAGKDWPDWTEIASPKERKCLMATFHKTNEHAFKIQGKEYKRRKLDINRTSNFISDLSRASLFTKGVDYGDVDKPMVRLINGFYADRAESSVKPEHDY